MRIAIPLLLTGLMISSTTFAGVDDIKAGAKQAGAEIKDAAIEVGHASKEMGKKVADTAVEVGHATRDAAVKAGHATKEGAKEVANKVKGNSSSQSK